MNDLHATSHTISNATCTDVEELLPLIAEGLMDADSDPDVFIHLADCEHCSQSLILQDMITLNLGNNINMKQTPRENVVYFHIPKTILSAAAILLFSCAALLAHNSYNASHTNSNQAHADLDQIAVGTQNVPETEILKIIPAQSSDDVPMILIRHHGQNMLIRQDQIDSGTTNAEVSAAMPVVVSTGR